MYFAYLVICLVLGYLSGSMNFAILISRWVRGIDIRNVGNKNPGTANVGRELGKGWAALVLAGDLAKGLIPLVLIKTYVFPTDHYADYFALFLAGIMVITGHCWPVYHQFRGGGGLATSIGIYMFFIPIEFFTALLLGFLTVQLFFRGKKYPLGQVTPMVFIPLAPVLVFLSSLSMDIEITDNLRIGGHPWYVITGVIALSVYIIIVNIRIVLGRLSKV